MLLRNVDMRVERTLWSSPSADRPAPESFNWVGLGWQFEGITASEDRTPMAAEASPRFEVGHTYVIALDRVPGTCGEGPGSWDGLSAEGAIPFDHGTLGAGEFGGRLVTADKLATSDEGSTLREEVAGDPVSTLTHELTSVEDDTSPVEECD